MSPNHINLNHNYEPFNINTNNNNSESPLLEPHLPRPLNLKKVIESYEFDINSIIAKNKLSTIYGGT
jgi:hypothetical protein